MKIKLLYLIIFISIIIFPVIFFLKREDTHSQLNWQLNDELTYNFNITSKINNLNLVNFQQNHSGNVDYSITGDLLVKVVDVSEDTVILYSVIDNFSRVINQRQISYKYNLYPFIITLSNTGQIIDFTFSSLINSENKNEIKFLIYSFQIFFEYDKLNWTAVEKDLSGTYKTKYNLNKNILSREIIEYIFVENDDFDDLSADIKLNNSEFAISENKSWFDSIITESKIDFYEKNNKVFSTEIKSKINLIETDATNDFWKTNFDLNTLINKLKKPFVDRTEEEIADFQSVIIENEYSPSESDKNFIKEHNYYEHFQSLLQQYLQEVDSHEKRNIQNILITLLKMYPELSGDFIFYILNNQNLPKEISSLFPLLAKVGHQEAQNALIYLSKDANAEPLTKLSSLVALASIDLLTDETIFEMINMAQSNYFTQQDINNTLLLSIGVIANNARFSTVKEQANMMIKRKLESQKDINADNIAYILGSAGNTANPEFIPLISNYIFNSENEFVYKNAIQSLGNMPLSKTENIFEKILLQENYIKRMSALQTLAEKRKISENLNKILLRQLSKENDVEERELIVRNLLFEKDNWEYLNEIASNPSEYWRIRKRIYSVIPIK